MHVTVESGSTAVPVCYFRRTKLATMAFFLRPDQKGPHKWISLIQLAEADQPSEFKSVRRASQTGMVCAQARTERLCLGGNPSTKRQ